MDFPLIALLQVPGIEMFSAPDKCTIVYTTCLNEIRESRHGAAFKCCLYGGNLNLVEY